MLAEGVIRLQLVCPDRYGRTEKLSGIFSIPGSRGNIFEKLPYLAPVNGACGIAKRLVEDFQKIIDVMDLEAFQVDVLFFEIVV